MSLKSAYVEDLEAGNVKHADEVIAREIGAGERLVATFDKPVEHARVHALRQRGYSPIDLKSINISMPLERFLHLIQVLAFVHPLGADFHARFDERLDEFVSICAPQLAGDASLCKCITMSFRASKSSHYKHKARNVGARERTMSCPYSSRPETSTVLTVYIVHLSVFFTRALLELSLADVHYAGAHGVELVLLLLLKAHDVE